MLGIASRYFAGRFFFLAVATAAAVALGLLTGMDGDGHIVMFGTIVLGTAAAAFVACRAGSSHRRRRFYRSRKSSQLSGDSCMVADYGSYWHRHPHGWPRRRRLYRDTRRSDTSCLSNRVDL